MLQIVIFSVFVGVALLSMAPDKSRPLLELLGSLQEVCMTVVRWAMLLAPLAVFGLMARLTSTVGLEVLLGMAVYVGTVLLGLLFLLLLYMALILFVGKRSPLAFLKGSKEVMLLAFSTSSSAAVMPLSIQTAERELGVRPSVSQFIIPLGATINMNGTALYQGVATVFLAQVYGIDLSLAAMTFVVVTAVSASIGAPATPGVGIVILATILQGVGIPPGGIAMIIGVDRILDMSRTAINVTGDLTACAVMDRWVGGRTTMEEQIRQEEELELRREQSGEDVITGPA
jgi:Na+/H+-dicarboxylate symporter